MQIFNDLRLIDEQAQAGRTPPLTGYRFRACDMLPNYFDTLPEPDPALSRKVLAVMKMGEREKQKVIASLERHKQNIEILKNV